MLNDFRVHMLFIIVIYILMTLLHINLLLDTDSKIYLIMIIISWILLVLVAFEQIKYTMKNNKKEKTLEVIYRENNALHYASRIFEMPVFGLITNM